MLLSTDQKRALIDNNRGDCVAITSHLAPEWAQKAGAKSPYCYMVSTYRHGAGGWGLIQTKSRATIAAAYTEAQIQARVCSPRKKTLKIVFDEKSLGDFISHRRERRDCDMARTLANASRLANLSHFWQRVQAYPQRAEKVRFFLKQRSTF